MTCRERWVKVRVVKLLMALVFVASVVVPSFALAADDAGVSDPVSVAPQESEEIHTSDESLATSLFIPFCFIGATLLIFMWAIRNRARRGQEDEPMPWWRTHQWYTRDDEDAG